jgi:O-antigen ligase
MVERLLFWYFLLLPFQFALNPLPGFDLALSRVAAIGIGIIFLWQRLRAGTWMIPPPTSLFSLMGLVFLALLSMFWSQEPYWTLRKSLFLISFLPIWFACVDTLQRERTNLSIRIASGFFFGAMLAALTALAQFFAQWVFSIDQVLRFWLAQVHPFFLGEAFSQSVAAYPSLLVNIGGKTILRAVGVFPDPHVAAFYFGMALPFGLWLGMRNIRGRGFFFFGSGVVLLADLCTFSRGGYVGLGALLLGFFFWKLIRHRMQIPTLVFWRGLVLGGVALLLLGSITPLRERALDIFSLTEGSNVARIALWSDSLGYIAESPWLGYGLGNYPLRVKPSAEYREPIYIHDTYLDIFAELGLVGLGLFLAFFLLPAGKFFFRARPDHIAFPASLAFILFFAHAFFETAIFSVHIFPVLLFLQALFPWYTRERT